MRQSSDRILMKSLKEIFPEKLKRHQGLETVYTDLKQMIFDPLEARVPFLGSQLFSSLCCSVAGAWNG
jgi:hypothetical protein